MNIALYFYNFVSRGSGSFLKLTLSQTLQGDIRKFTHILKGFQRLFGQGTTKPKKHGDPYRPDKLFYVNAGCVSTAPCPIMPQNEHVNGQKSGPYLTIENNYNKKP